MVKCLEQKDLEQKQKQRKKDGNYINHKTTNRGDTITHMRKETDENVLAINTIKTKWWSTPLESDQRDPSLLKMIDLRPQSQGSRVSRPRIVLHQRVLGLPQLRIHH